MTDRDAVEGAIESALTRIEALEPDIRALVAEDDRRGRLQKAVDELFARFPDPAARPPLFGTLFGVKDIFHVEGLPTRAGSRLPLSALAGPEATSVRQLRDAGAIVLAKTVTTEFAYFAPGPTRNPRDLAHTPGGSSSGSAAAVAAGYCPIALGTQTIGSINRPAAFCGVYGFKPSHGRISCDGVIPLSTTLDHVGVLASDLEALETSALALLSSGGAEATTTVSPVLGLPIGPYLHRADAEARAHLDTVCERLGSAGYPIRPVPMLDDIGAVEARHRTIVARDIATTHADWYASYSDRYHARTRELIEEGRPIEEAVYRRARAERDRFHADVVALMEREAIDLWITPSAPGPAPAGIESTGDPILNLPWTQAGLPTVTVPAGTGPSGLPLGLQIVGRWQGDELLLALARKIVLALGERT